jgi:hypothetical protein
MSFPPLFVMFVFLSCYRVELEFLGIIEHCCRMRRRGERLERDANAGCNPTRCGWLSDGDGPWPLDASASELQCPAPRSSVGIRVRGGGLVRCDRSADAERCLHSLVPSTCHLLEGGS